MSIIKKYYYKKMFKEINNANEQILKADKWEDVKFAYEARPPYTCQEDIENFNLIKAYCQCVNMSYRAEEKVRKLHKEWCDRQKSSSCDI